MRKRISPYWVAILLTSLSAGSSFSATITWTNTAGGNWSVAANWSPNQVPTSADTAQITTSGTYAVTNNGTGAAGVLTLGGASGTQTLLLSGGSLSLSSASTGNAQAVLNITGGTLGGIGSLVLAGPLNWSGGTITNSVQFSGGTFSGSLTLNAGEVINNGTLGWTASSMNVGNGSVISNSSTGIINLTVNLSQGTFAGAHTFDNAGQLNIAVSGTANISDAFNNTGSVTINGGTLDLNGGGTSSGSFTAVSGTTLEFGGGTYTINSGTTFTGAGNLTVQGSTVTVGVALNLSGTWTFASGTVTLNGTTTVSGNPVIVSGGTVNFSGTGPWQPATLTISGGTLGGTTPVTVQNSGGMAWSGGVILSNLVQFSGGTFSGSLTLNAGEVINNGTLGWTASSMNVGNGSVISNSSTGIINLTVNLSQGAFAGAHTFDNAGQLNIAVSGTANISDTFNNTGSVTINGGTLDLNGGGTSSGSFTAVSGTTLEFGGGTYTINSGTTLSGAGNLTVQLSTVTVGVALNLSGTWTFISGTVTLNGTTTVSGNPVIISGGTVNFSGTGPWQPATLTISGGTLGGTTPVTVQNSGGMAWSGGTITNSVQFSGGTFSGFLNLNAGQVINNGTLSWTASSMNVGNGSVISNSSAGTINLTANLGQGTIGGAHTFDNAGQLNVAVSGTANISDAFNNTGSVTINGGTLDLSGGGTSIGSFTAASGTTLDFGGGIFSVNAGTTLSGAGNFTVAGSTITVGVPLNLGGTWTFASGTATLSSTSVSGNPVIVSGGTVNFSGTGPWQPATLTVSVGALGGTTPVTVLNSGGMAWSGGIIVSNLVQFSGGTFSGSLSLNAGQVINNGTLSWTATSMSVGDGSIISNSSAGTINLTANLNQGVFGGAHTFDNAGQLNVAVSGTANISDIFNNTGAVAINGGTLNLAGGGTESGSFTVASGATNEFGNGTFAVNSGATISGSGTFLNAGNAVANFAGTSVLNIVTVIGSGTVNFNNSTSLNLPTLTFNGGALQGTNPVMVAGSFVWTGGGIMSNLVQFNGGTFTNTVDLNDGGEIVNTGTLKWAANAFNDGNGSIVSNAPTGTINVTTNFSEGTLGGTRTFNNAGQLNVTISGTADIAANFTNTGTVKFNSGILELSGTRNLAGGTLNFGINALNNYGSNQLGNAANLAGTLKSVFSGSYLPSVGNTYNIMTYSSSSGSFSTTNLSPLAVWTVNQNAAALSITVVKLVPQVAWATPTDIVYGTALSGSQLNATASWNGTNVPGVFNYTPLSGTVLNSGSNQILSVTFVPTDSSTFTNVTTSVLINVQKAPLTVTATNMTKSYGQTINFAGTEFTTTGLVNGDNVTGATLASAGAAPTATVAGSPYTITITNAVGDAGLTNYIITYATGQITVNPALLGITANNRTKTYGQTITFAGTEFTPTGLQNSETVGSVTLTSAGASATASVAGSPYSIVPSAATGGTFDPNNYSISYFNGALTVNKAPLGITANNRTKTYGQVVTFAGTEFTPTGLQNSETVGSVTLTSAGTNATATVAGSPYSIVPSAATGGTFNPNNYSIGYTNGMLTVNTAPLGITANNRTKTYGQTITFAGTEFTPTGLQNSETVGSVTLASAGTNATATVAGSPYNIVPSAATGGTFNPNNYSIGYTNGTLTVNTAPLGITANNRTKTYGQTVTFAGTEFTPTGLQNSETVGSVTLTSAGTNATASVAGSPYNIVPSAATGGTFNPNNYSIGYTNGTLTVGTAPLGITANNRTKTYGQTVTFAGTEFTAAGLQNSETVGSVTLTSAGASATATVAGSPYNIVPSAATGGTFNPNNYSIGYTNGTLSVNGASLTITADNTNKIVGEALTFAGTEFTAAGLQNSETVGTVTLTSAGAAAGAAAGGYPIVPSAPSGGTFSQGNYTNSFVNGTLTVVGPPSLTITVNGNQEILTFQAMLGQSYQLQTATNLTSSWTPLGVPVSGASGTVNVTNSISFPQAFSRLQIQLGP